MSAASTLRRGCDERSIRMSNIAKSFVFVAFTLIAATVLLEGVFLLMLHVPSITAISPRPARQLVQQIYRHFNRALIQFDPACAVYDKEVTYTLKPGTCTFGNLEFNNTYHINKLGLRDADTSLEAPEIVVLGDSHAMGWGVEQDETLAAVLKQKSGLKVLNAAISSYGTAREMTVLNRIDTSRLRVLIVQYADNDLPENRTFRDHDGHLPITPQADYQKIQRYYAAQRSYYPGKYVFRLTMKVMRLEEPEPDQLKMDIVPPTEEADLFLYVLTHAARVPLDDVLVIVFEVNQDGERRRPFIVALDEVKRREGNPRFVRRLITLDTASVLSGRDFYILDDHMKASGHRAIADTVSKLIQTDAGGK
jgi:hypothetical protein